MARQQNHLEKVVNRVPQPFSGKEQSDLLGHPSPRKPCLFILSSCVTLPYIPAGEAFGGLILLIFWKTIPGEPRLHRPRTDIQVPGFCCTVFAQCLQPRRIHGVEACARACRCEARWGLVPEKTRPERRNSPGTCHTFDSSAARQPQAGSKNST